jgi:hypothetical protein
MKHALGGTMIFKGARIMPDNPLDMRVKIKHMIFVDGKWKVIDHMRKGDVENLEPKEAKSAKYIVKYVFKSLVFDREWS